MKVKDYVYDQSIHLLCNTREEVWERVVNGTFLCTKCLPNKGKFLGKPWARNWYLMSIRTMGQHLRQVYQFDKKRKRHYYNRVRSWFVQRYEETTKREMNKWIDVDDEYISRFHADLCLLYTLKPRGSAPVPNPFPNYSNEEWLSFQNMKSTDMIEYTNWKRHQKTVRKRACVQFFAMGVFMRLLQHIRLGHKRQVNKERRLFVKHVAITRKNLAQRKSD